MPPQKEKEHMLPGCFTAKLQKSPARERMDICGVAGIGPVFWNSRPGQGQWQNRRPFVQKFLHGAG